MSYILIVDDDLDTRQILQDICSHMGHEAEMAEDGLIGIESARKRQPDLILMDIMMPEMNGLEMLSRLRSNPRTNGVPVIVLSAIGAEQMSGMPNVSAVFHKSRMSIADLRECISKALGQPSLQNTAANH